MKVLGHELLHLVIIQQDVDRATGDSPLFELEDDTVLAAADFGGHVQCMLKLLVLATALVEFIDFLVDGLEQLALLVYISHEDVQTREHAMALPVIVDVVGVFSSSAAVVLHLVNFHDQEAQ